MSESTNVELLRAGTEAYNRGDLTFVFERAAEDIEVFAHPRLLNSGTYHGRAGFEKWVQEWYEAWSETTIEFEKIEEVEERFLVVEVRQRAVGRSSGVPVEMELVQVLEVRDSQIVRFHLYPDRDLADAALKTFG